ncbi:MAG TPA: hypothetical protein VJR58_27045 [Vineibacter sp.]|nr:hypothetical protein [Vineibacter sp.]
MLSLLRACVFIGAVALLGACTTTSDRPSDGRWYLQPPTDY